MRAKRYALVIGIMLTVAAVTAVADWIPGDGHKMHWPQLPDEHGWNVKAFSGQLLADDFRCTQSGPITDIHFWGSWKGGVEGQIQGFWLTIYADIPDPNPSDPNTHSEPGGILWGPVYISNFIMRQITPAPPAMEGWTDPLNGEVLIRDHSTYFQYNIFSFPDPFVQTEGEIYWLGITADVFDDGTPGTPQWGWKSTQDHFNDDAVLESPTGWTEMYEPETGPLSNGFDGNWSLGNDFVGGFGEYAYDNQWFYYPQYDWWNVWFYDHPYDPTRHKDVMITGQVAQLQPGLPSDITIAVNWSTDEWSLNGNPAGPRRPPLPADGNEDIYIGRAEVFQVNLTDPAPVPFEVSFSIPDYNPEWISIDVRANNVHIDGVIGHECIGNVPRSMDLAFVINGDPIADPTGACCHPDGTCTIETQLDCESAAIAGTYMGDGTVCLGDSDGDGNDDLCVPVPTGACCWPDGTCTIETKADCEDPANPNIGTYMGDGTVCQGDANNDGIDDACGAAVIRGACCLQDGSCIVATSNECGLKGGSYLGDNTVCLGDANNNGVDDACETPAKKGACCWLDGTCSVVTAAKCVKNNGSYLGDNTACLGDSDLNGVDDACEKPDPDFKWEQLPDLDPTGFDVICTEPALLADDFECTVTGPITRIHVYGSWFADFLPPGGPTDVSFVLSIHSDIPAVPGDPDSYSMPGELLCLLTDLPFEVQPYATDLEEGVYWPGDVGYMTHGDKVCWEYIFYLPPDICIQQGTPTSPMVYWLDVQAFPSSYPPPSQMPLFGWKSSLEHWMDDATWALGVDDFGAVLDWQELIYPAPHPMAGESIDLAFKIIGSEGTPTPTGACCWPDGTCTIETKIDCENAPNGVFGTYQGDGTVCLGDQDGNGIDDACDAVLPTGACCELFTGTCSNTTQAACVGHHAWYAGQDCNDPNFVCLNQPPEGACCWEDAAGNMNCDNTTQAECHASYGGTWYLGQDCATFDCPTPQPMGACCYGDPASPSCVYTTEDQCKLVYNGHWYANQDCTTIDCPTVVEFGACCYEDAVAGSNCVNTTKADCLKSYGGTWYAGQDCSTVDCGHQPPIGACCYGDPANPSCINTTYAECLSAYGGTWYANTDCATFDCPIPPETGACCYEDAAGNEACVNSTQLECKATYGGTWYANVDCANFTCPDPEPLGACCYAMPPICVTTTEDQCQTVYGGIWYAGQDCATFDCPTTEPTGACCWPDGSCTIETQADCENAAGSAPGTYMGDGTICAGDNNGNGVDDMCEGVVPRGACCWQDGTCTIEYQANCVNAATPGTYQGDGTVCLGDGDGNGVDDACEDPPPDWKWLQPPDLEPTGMDVRMTEPVILADDFLCTRPGDIREISIWASWYHDEWPSGTANGYEDVTFVLSLHTDIPATHVAIPVPECPSSGDGWDIVGGLPGGTSIRGSGRLHSPDQMALQAGGILGGDITTEVEILELSLTGTGALQGFQRTLQIPVDVEIHTGLPSPGERVQDYPTEMVQLQGELFGDPDFCTFRVQAGRNFGLPSPGHTTLTQGQDGGDFAVDSFFDITYRIEFVGCPGSILEGFGGTTEGPVRLVTPEVGTPECTTPNIGTYSRPGEVICLTTFEPGSFTAQMIPVAQEDWYDPFVDHYESPGDWTAFKYTFPFAAGQCMQEGTPDDPIVYWLDVQAIVPIPEMYIGWKTSRVHRIDDAAWNTGVEPVSTPWNELRYPPQHPFYPQSLDLAFEVRSKTSCCVGQVGDANQQGSDEPTIGDVSVMIDAKFITGVCVVDEGTPQERRIIECLEEADANQSANGDATCDDITIGDISILIDYLFISGPYDAITNPSGIILNTCR